MSSSLQQPSSAGIATIIVQAIESVEAGVITPQQALTIAAEIDTALKTGAVRVGEDDRQVLIQQLNVLTRTLMQVRTNQYCN